MKTITAVYKMIVYDDGDVEMKPMPLDYIFDSLDDWNTPIVVGKVSGKVSQIMSVLSEVNDLLHDESTPFSLTNDISTYRQMINIAIKNIAYQLEVTEQTVADKLTRGLGINKQCFIELVCDFFEKIYTATSYKTSDLYKTIKENISDKKYDLQYVDDVFIKIIE